jgi:glycerol-3-phosphate O-acyltransferase
VVGAPLVAVVSAPAGVQQLVGQVQDLVIQNVAVQNVVPEIPMEVEDEDAVLQRLFFKKYGRALPEQEKEKESDVDNIKFVIDLTDEKDEEMEVATSNVVPVAVVKTEPIEIANVSNVANTDKVAADRKERRELVKARKALIAFGKTLRKSEVIPEKEAPLAAGNVIADTDSNVSEANSVNPVGPESLTTDEAIEMAEAAIAESDAAVNQKVMDEFDDESEFQLYGPEDVLPSDDEDNMINDV